MTETCGPRAESGTEKVGLEVVGLAGLWGTAETVWTPSDASNTTYRSEIMAEV